MSYANINLLAVVVAAIVNMVLGALWYSPALFGKQLMNIMNVKPKDMAKMKNEAKKSYVYATILALIMAVVIEILTSMTASQTAIDGAFFGFLVWLGLALPITSSGVLWEGRNKTLFMINAGYYLVALVIMGAILGAW